MFDQEDQVLHAGVLGDSDPDSGVELVGLPFLVEVVVDLDGRGPLTLTDAELAAAGAPRDQPISSPVRLTGPQQLNMPNRTSCQASTTSGLARRRSVGGSASAAGESAV